MQESLEGRKFYRDGTFQAGGREFESRRPRQVQPIFFRVFRAFSFGIVICFYASLTVTLKEERADE
jgi:hypothetical protein